MTTKANRREFLGRTALVGAGLGLGPLLATPETEAATAPISKAPIYKISIAQWSLHRTIRAGKLDNLDSGEHVMTTVFSLPDSTMARSCWPSIPTNLPSPKSGAAWERTSIRRMACSPLSRPLYLSETTSMGWTVTVSCDAWTQGPEIESGRISARYREHAGAPSISYATGVRYGCLTSVANC